MSFCGNRTTECDKLKTLLLPLFPNEHEWNPAVRSFLYFVALLYSFIGVSLVADIFMGSIEKITSQTRKVSIAKKGGGGKADFIQVRIWNGTVANLTLMALGSSAPEILLAIVETVKNKFEAGDLGPGTIVGSAAFNLLAITAVCIVAIPDGEGRSIRLIKVFWVTSVVCFFAYVWLIVVLNFVSPDIVELWEALLTLSFFPLLVTLAWWADKGFPLFFWRSQKGIGGLDAELGVTSDGRVRTTPTFYNSNGDLIKDELVEFYKSLRKYPHLSEQDAVTLAATKLIDSQPRSMMWYRIGAVRGLAGSKKIHQRLTKKLQVVYDAINSCPTVPLTATASQKKNGKTNYPPNTAIIEFLYPSSSVPENVGNLSVSIVRHGRLDNTVRVRVKSIDGTATEGSDYIRIDQELEFGPNVQEMEITVKIVDDNQWEPDEEFFLQLSLLDNQERESRDVALGQLSVMEIIILDDDEPGILAFKNQDLLVKESCGSVDLEVERTGGSDGQVSVRWKTIDGSASKSTAYKKGEGTLHFKHGQTMGVINIPILGEVSPDKEQRFDVELFDPIGGVTLGDVTTTTVTISSDEDFQSALQRWTEMTAATLKSMQAVHEASYKSQIYAAVTVNGGHVDGASKLDYFLHILTFFWKVIFSFIPPPNVWGGWPSFFFSLGTIGIMTAIIGDLATIFGCFLGLKDAVTAITIVSVGTSLPDLFASKMAAVREKHADNAIGNVTGSNSVNIFLGLGLPWVLAAIYHQGKGQKFEVRSGSIAFSVLVYSIVAFSALSLLMLRRHLNIFGKTELGGPKSPKWASAIFLLTLWMIYIILSSLQSYCVIQVDI